MDDINQRALEAAHQIEDLFCQSFPGGRGQRVAAIQVAIAKKMQAMWDERVVAMSLIGMRGAGEKNGPA